MRAFVDGHDWLSVVQLPAYAPELNPTEGAWSHVKRGLGNLAACSHRPTRRDRAEPTQVHTVPTRAR
ncbi:transposase [Amycolatopsis pigmentata]|uniref:Transposase n=1 Tax=Amycolatopsis pigmentata TaxID=450801 RepID=A0ABW5FIY5_9PSEU